VLTGYSQAYQAAAQVISTAHTMFESLLTDI
jgi:flagellar hook-associated protein FlgK